MGLLKLFKSEDSVSKKDIAKIEQVAEVCSSECEDCKSSSADIERDEARVSSLKIDHETPLFGSSKSSKVHFVVPTSQTDWAHDACAETEGTVQWELAQWIDANSGKFKGGEGDTMRCSVSSLPKDIMDIDVMRGRKNDVLVLPHFLLIKHLKAEDVAKTAETVVPLLLENKRDELLAMENIEEAKEQAFVFLCSHKTRDKRCGITAPILQKGFFRELQEHDLYRDPSDFRPGGCNVAFVNHLGGHKFAANVLIYLRRSHSLIWLGRVTPKHIPVIVNTMIVPEKPRIPWPEKVRCVQKYSGW
ncbi:LAQU0S03e08284g1_1 [Lachancea quebecensis]|uniref:LAQU0S03e08284g1_1 n=1 Tax=Lachancea quebecensis TaxID=1654605 RepID=A0A0N7ML98_9SACH|nr:LAQU0S03e08284g1_1 [Lachancea quebecensis]